jgi:hypothetical protein
MASEGLPSRSADLVEQAIHQLADLNDKTGDKKLDMFITKQYQVLLDLKDAHSDLEQLSLPIKQSRSLLDALSKDVILSVADYLDPISALCFALCNHELHESMGENFCRTLRDGDAAERRELVTLLVRDRPHVYLCKRMGCSKLHHYKTVTWPNGTQLLKRSHEMELGYTPTVTSIPAYVQSMN